MIKIRKRSVIKTHCTLEWIKLSPFMSVNRTLLLIFLLSIISLISSGLALQLPLFVSSNLPTILFDDLLISQLQSLLVVCSEVVLYKLLLDCDDCCSFILGMFI